MIRIQIYTVSERAHPQADSDLRLVTTGFLQNGKEATKQIAKTINTGDLVVCINVVVADNQRLNGVCYASTRYR